jgi:hypothetical protein
VSDDSVPAEPRLASINRQQLILRSIDVERLIDEDHGARLIWQLIGRLNLSLYHAQIEALDHAPRRTVGDNRVQAEDGNAGSKTNLCAALADRRVPARLDQGALPVTPVSLSGSREDDDGSDLGLPELQPHTLVQLTTQAQFRTSTHLNPRPSATIGQAATAKSHSTLPYDKDQFLHSFLSSIFHQ